MKVSLNWVKQFTELKLSNDELVDRVNRRLGAVESVVGLGPAYARVVVGEIVGAKDHPDADKLGVYKVKVGASKTVQVVAGDRNLRVGDKVAYIPPGSAVPATFFDDEPFIIQKVILRGEESNGMLGSAHELAFSDDHKGVLKLDTAKPVGTLLSEAYELDDVIIEIENKTLTNRPDCFGVVGLARELAGLQDSAFRTPKWLSETTGTSGHGLKLEVLIDQPDDTPRYSALAMDGVTVGPSPQIMQSYLSRLGIRPINNVVDITNYLMVMTGQPLHAFDFDKVGKGDAAEIIVRRPKKGERLALLDGRTIEPHPEAILIAKPEGPIALGGVMGGADSEIGADTTRIIIESANFNMYSVRKTSMEHGIFTEAVTRFARGQDPAQTVPVLLEAARLVSKHAGGQPASAVVDAYPKKRKVATVTVAPEFINGRLGATLSAGQMAKTLKNIEISVAQAGGALRATAPSWRPDLAIAEDYVEEVGRLNGYENLAITLPPRTLEPPARSSLVDATSRARDLLVAAGANELLTYSFLSEEQFTRSGLDVKRAYRLRNALSPALRYVRTAVTPSLLDKVRPNQRAGFEEFALFEINKAHARDELDDEGLPLERTRLALVVSATGKAADALEGAPYYQSKRYLDHLLGRWGVVADFVRLDQVKTLPKWLKDLAAMFEPARAAVIMSAGQPVGLVGEYRLAVRQGFRLPETTSGFELSLEPLLAAPLPAYQALSRFPGTDADVTLAVKDEVAMEEVRRALASALAQPGLQVSVSAHDAFQDKPVVKHLTYRITLRHEDYTLKTEEANSLVDGAVAKVARDFDAKRV